jgi:predicted DNA-binding transcriptional regulator AlpA
MKMLTKQLVAARYSVTERTIDRWAESGVLPMPMRINARCYWDESEIEKRERDRMAAAQQPASTTA